MTTPATAAELAQLVADQLPVASGAQTAWKIRKEPARQPLSDDSIWTLRSPDGPVIALTFKNWPHARRGRLQLTLELPAELVEYYGDDPALPRPEFRADATPQDIAAKITSLLLPIWPRAHALALSRKSESDTYKRGCHAVSTALVAELGDDLAVEQDWSYVGLRPGNGLVQGDLFIRSPRSVVVQLSVDHPAVAVALARALAIALSTQDSETIT